MHTISVTTSHQRAPIAVVMITLNEAHNLEAVLDNLQNWAEQVFIVDSYSSDATIDIALRRGVHVVQHAFTGFGEQWNFALQNLPITVYPTAPLLQARHHPDRATNRAGVGSVHR